MTMEHYYGDGTAAGTAALRRPPSITGVKKIRMLIYRYRWMLVGDRAFSRTVNPRHGIYKTLPLSD